MTFSINSVAAVQNTLSSVYFTFTLNSFFYTVHSILYMLHSILYTVHSKQYTVHSILYSVHSTQHTVHSILNTLYCTRNALYWTLYTVHSRCWCTLYTVHPILYTQHCTLCGRYASFCFPPWHLFLLKPHKTGRIRQVRETARNCPEKQPAVPCFLPFCLAGRESKGWDRFINPRICFHLAFWFRAGLIYFTAPRLPSLAVQCAVCREIAYCKLHTLHWKLHSTHCAQQNFNMLCFYASQLRL